MIKVTSNTLIIMSLLMCSLHAQDVQKLHNLGYVVVSPNGPEDGGDFGPKTPGTRTSGLQEAFDFAKHGKHSGHREVYVIGGSAKGTNEPAVYNLDTTLHIPWVQNWHCTGGNYVMNFTITEGDCLFIDSLMTADLKFGSVVAPDLESGALVKIKPVSVGPDAVVASGARAIRFNSIVGGSGKNKEGQVVGLHIDPSFGAICAPYISAAEIKNCDIGILMGSVEGGHGILDCVVECPIIRNCDIGIQVNSGYYNRINASLDPGNVSGPVLGVDIAGGYENIYTLSWQGSFEVDKALIFGNSARDNLVYAMNLPVDGVVNNASRSTNLIVPQDKKIPQYWFLRKLLPVKIPRLLKCKLTPYLFS